MNVSKSVSVQMDKEKGWTFLFIVVAATMGTLARMVYVEKRIPGTVESVVALVTSIGSAVVLAPLASAFVVQKFGVEPSDYLTSAIAWILGIMVINIVVGLAGLDVSKWIKKFRDGDAG